MTIRAQLIRRGAPADQHHRGNHAPHALGQASKWKRREAPAHAARRDPIHNPSTKSQGSLPRRVPKPRKGSWDQSKHQKPRFKAQSIPNASMDQLNPLTGGPKNTSIHASINPLRKKEHLRVSPENWPAGRRRPPATAPAAAPWPAPKSHHTHSGSKVDHGPRDTQGPWGPSLEGRLPPYICFLCNFTSHTNRHTFRSNDNVFQFRYLEKEFSLEILHQPLPLY